MAGGGGSILRLRGLPFSAGEEDIRSFLDGYSVKAVHLGAKNGKPTGEAYVQLDTAEEAARAMKERQHENMGTRYIEIFAAGEADLLASTSGGASGSASLSGHVVRLRGLPFSSTAADVVAFFEGVETVGGEGGIVFTCTPDGRPTGEAYVELASEEALAAALARHKEKIGARYIEIFQSSKGDMFQAVQQHGYFTCTGGRRRHHWHQQHGGAGGGGSAAAAAAASAQYQQDAGGGGGGGARSRGAQVDEMTNAFAGFGLSHRDMQVPGPPRWGAYGAPADQAYQQYGGVPPRQMQQGGNMQPGGMRWRPGGMQPGMQHFNPAPGPPPGKGGRGSVPNGARQSGGSGGGMMGMDYGSGGHGPTLMFNPFMMQHPLMVQHPQQHPGAAWGAGMMQQQGGSWYGGMQVGRGMHAQMGMAGAYTAYPGYYPMAQGRTGPSPPASGHQQHAQHGTSSRQQQSHSHTAHAAAGSQSGSAAPAAAPAVAPAQPADSVSSSQPVEEGAPAADERPGSSAAESAPPTTAAAGPPASPEQ
ncbi:hypothetical protein ABPG77_008144 [Micractinium sp. CCAP 211/92]